MLSNRHLFLLNQAQTSDFPLSLEIESAKGMYLFDVSGKQYMDLISGIGVSSLGHCHPNVVDAIQHQAGLYLHTMVYGEMIQSPTVRLAQKLASLLPDALDNVYFTNSGAEAIEGAMKLCKRYTGRTQIISFKDAYHGSTQGALSIQGNEQFKNAFRPLLPDCLVLNYNVTHDLQYITEQTAAVFVEAIQSESGYNTPCRAWFRALRERCTQVGALLVVDEIQTGIGRSGRWFAFEHWGIVPDVLTLAKALGGGMPLGCFVASKAVMDSLKQNPILGHITTFGGNAVCCAAGLAVLQTIEQERLMAGIDEKEQLFRKLLHHKKIHRITGKGLMLAVGLPSFEFNIAVNKLCIEKGLLVDWFLFNDKALRIAPPLTIGLDEIAWACGVILESINQVSEN